MKKELVILFFLFSFLSGYSQTNYSELKNWAAHPWKKDASDSISNSLKNELKSDSLVDIFFIHPTTYTSERREFGMNANIDDESLNMKTNNSTILYQASVFNNIGRIFAPRYRQANLGAYFPETSSDTIESIAAFDTAYADVKNAFEYYLKNWNSDRPIIIASHSQGTTHAKRLIKEFFDGKELQQKLIVAYLVGMNVEYNWFNNIPSCTKPNQTDCYCTWRTFKKGYKPDFVLNETDSTVVTNPLTWDIEKPFATRQENPGTILWNFNKIKTGIVDASVEGNVLWAKKPRFFGNIFLFTRNYHIADYNFFYMSIRENAKQRVENYFKNNNN